MALTLLLLIFWITDPNFVALHILDTIILCFFIDLNLFLKLFT